MGKSDESFWDSAVFRRTLSRWAYSARTARQSKLSSLRKQAVRAKQLRGHLDELIVVAEDRLSQPLDDGRVLPQPHNADWAWRPSICRERTTGCRFAPVPQKCDLGPELKLFHDCGASEMTVRQCRNQGTEDEAPFGLGLDVFDFTGGYLSLVLDLPEDGAFGLSRRNILMLETRITVERPLEIFARLNIVHGPNTEQIVREVDTSMHRMAVEFDLAYVSLNEKRIDKAWIDLIFESPRMNRIAVHDIVLSRRPRAQF